MSVSPLKSVVLFLCKACGLFSLARFTARHRLRIICYHSFELSDESRFRGKMFLRGATLRRRLQFLKNKGFPLVGLEEGLDGLHAGRLPNCSVVITIDDGLTGVARVAAPIFAEFNARPTLYVTTARLFSRAPEYHLIVQYIFWKTTRKEFQFAAAWWSTAGIVALHDPAKRKQVGKSCARALLSTDNMEERQARCAAIAETLAIDLNSILQLGSFTLMSPNDVRALAAQGFDIELHTHNHRLPADDLDTAKQEIKVNREQLRSLTNATLTHFCYPSGDWSPRHWPMLTELGVRSATTCDPGLNDAATPPLALRRFLDADSVSDIEFEAEVCGFLEWLRYLRTLGGLRSLGSAQPASDAI
jgi:peptidoglycan/xylan/chitin deacetylase (PgdA/CDA1 family)